MLFLFRENAADLFRHVRRQTQEQLLDQKIRTEDSAAPPGRRKKRPPKRLPHIARPSLPKDKTLDVEDFPEQLEEFAKDIKTFLKSLNEFPEFTDEAVNNSMNAFEADLKYWASCLKTYDGGFHILFASIRTNSNEGQFRYPAVQRYVHDLCGEMSDHLDTITSSLSMFLEIGESHPPPYLVWKLICYRYPNHSIRAEARRGQPPQPQYCSDLFLCRYGDNPPVQL